MSRIDLDKTLGRPPSRPLMVLFAALAWTWPLAASAHFPSGSGMDVLIGILIAGGILVLAVVIGIMVKVMQRADRSDDGEE